MYGTQAELNGEAIGGTFENDVKMYGTQAQRFNLPSESRLRMM